MRYFILIIAFLFSSVSFHAQAGEPLSHVITCPTQEPAAPGFADFLTKLKQAVAKKDVDYIKSIVADTIRSNYAGDDSKDAFLSYWKLNHFSELSEFWGEMYDLLALGYDPSNTKGDTIVYPCTFGELPKHDWIAVKYPDDVPYGYQVVVHEGVDLMSSDHKLLRRLAFLETVRFNDEKVTTFDGLTGDAEKFSLRSPTDYRAFFTREKGVWKLTTFIAGD